MSGLLNKVKNAVSGDKNTNQGVNAGDYEDSRVGGSSYDNTSGIGSTATGSNSSPYDSNIDPRVDGDSTRGTSGAGNTSYGSSTTAGPHSSNLANKADPRVDSDLDGNRGVTGSHGTSGTGNTGYGSSTAAGPHSSNLANKADPRVDSDLDGNRGTIGSHGTSGIGNTGSGSGLSSTGTSTAAGPHSSNLANKADPRVDSDLDGKSGVSGGYGSSGRGNAGYGSSTTDNTGLGSSGTSTTGLGSSGIGNTGYGSSNTAGPHSSNLANKADPRVDSDLDGSRNTSSGLTSSGTGTGSSGYGSNTGTTGYGDNTGTTGSGIGSGYDNTTGTGHHGQHHGHHHDHHHHGGEDIIHGGPHHTETANKLDPHVSGSGGPIEGITGGYGSNTGTTGSSGGYGSNTDTTGTSGGYGSNTSTTGTSGGYGSNTGTTGSTGDYETGSGNSGTTTGPHKSSLLNKLDPRTDKNVDSSNTYGGNRTTSGGEINASTATPSVFKAHHGEPTIAHDDPDNSYAKRHGSKVADDLRKYGNGIE